MKLKYLLIFATVFAITLQFSVYALTYDQTAYEQVMSSTISSSSSSNIVVQVLKYQPYPVNSGDWFDLWVKVQNTGQEDAPNAVFELQPEYPFSSNDSLVRNYGLIYGTVGSLKIDQTYDSSQVILKFRVKVAENAPTGASNIKLKLSSDSSASGTTYNLPIEIFSIKTSQPIQTVQTVEPSYLKWVYGAIGLITGMFIILLIVILRRKKK
jgi:hypothetical protein